MKNAEYCRETGCPQRDSAEHEAYAGAQSIGTQEIGETDGARLLEAILAWLLLECEYEDNDAKMGRMVETPLSDVYLEAVEEAKDKSSEPDKAGDP